jgi:hypothetical protein
MYTCEPAQNPSNCPQVLPAYGLQDLWNEHQEPKTRSNPNTMYPQITLGENHGTGHFYFALTPWQAAEFHSTTNNITKAKRPGDFAEPFCF